MPIIQRLAEEILEKAKAFPAVHIYNALREMEKGIVLAAKAAQKGDLSALSSALEDLGLTGIEAKGNASRLLSLSTQSLNPLIYAFGARSCSWDYYKKYIIGERDELPYIMAYDLTGSRRKVVPEGEELSGIDELLHRMARNWIIALNGKLSTAELNAGDLRYGFFPSLEKAIHAASWMLHHVDQLSYTSRMYPGSHAYGVVITRGDSNVDGMGNVSGRQMDFSGYWLKGKLKSAVDESAGEVGRKEKEFPEGQLWILEHDGFNLRRDGELPVSAPRQYIKGKTEVTLSSVDVEKFIADRGVPWIRAIRKKRNSL